MKKALKVILPVILLFATASPALADGVITSSFGGYMYPVPISSSNPWSIGGTAGNYALVYDITSNDYFTYLGHQVPFTRTTAEPWASPTRVGHTFALVASSALSGACTTSSYANCRASAQYRGETDFVYGVAAPPPPVVGLFDSKVIMASVVESVQTSGTLIWPLFVFVGILIAFYIAMRVGDFVRKAAGARAARGSSRSKPYEEEYTPEQVSRITDKIKELGDRDSFDE